MGSRKWFHPHISGLEAEELLLTQGMDGAYLVRPSKSSPGDFTLSVKRGSEVTHIKIQSTGDFFDLYGGEKFATLAELIEYYTENKGQLKERNGQVIDLIYPILSQDPTSERWFHGNLTGREAERALTERGQSGSFLVRASQSKPGDFVLSVRGDQGVSHVMIQNRGGKFDVGGGDQFNGLTELIEHYKKNPLVEVTGNIIQLKQPFNATRVTVASIGSRFQELCKEEQASDTSGGFLEEFEQLQRTETDHMYSRNEGARPENKSKNRYKNILPYDHTRVKLKNVSNEPGADYINANFIDGEAKGTRHAYIGCQGCLKATIPSFWQMLWEQNCHIIVMTTNIVERGKNKCAQYWPNKGQFAEYGNFVVTLVEEANFGFYVRRTLSVEHNGESRTLFQYHYIAWPDHGVPDDPAEVLTLLLTVKDHVRRIKSTTPDTGPLVVHCSAGIGRTGTFIVIDALLDVVQEKGVDTDIDIQQSIRRVREQRSGLIQTVNQYKFVYEAISSHLEYMRAHLETGRAPVVPELYASLATFRS